MIKSVCDNCALRLYNTKSYNIQGIGNPFYGNCIVVPNVDYKAYKGKSMDFSTQVEIIKDTLRLSTGVEDFNFYIIPLIRCNENISCEITSDIINKCLIYLNNDINRYKFKNILLLGSAVTRLFNISISNYINDVFISKNGIKYFINYSPLVKYNDNKLFEIFKHNLLKWNNYINNNTFNYNIRLI